MRTGMITAVNVEVFLPVFEGFEYTGERRQAELGEGYLGNDNVKMWLWTLDTPSTEHFFIMRRKHWRAKHGENYFTVGIRRVCDVFEDVENYTPEDDDRYKSGLYKRTEKEAQEVADKIKKLLKDHRGI